jgi:hypothetical protein
MSVNILYQTSTHATAGRDGQRFANLSPANERQFSRASRRLPKCPKLLYLCRGIESHLTEQVAIAPFFRVRTKRSFG